MIFNLSPFSVAKDWSDCASNSKITRAPTGIEALGCNFLLAHPGGPVEPPHTISCSIPPDRQPVRASSPQITSPTSSPFGASVPITLSTDGKLLRKQRVRPMDRFCFTGTFCQLTPKIISELDTAFNTSSGKLPSRGELRVLGQRLGISQSQIRRWFLEHDAPKLEPTQSSLAASEQLANLEKRLEKMEQRISVVEQQVQVQRSTISQTIQPIRSLPFDWSQDFFYD